MLYIVCWCINGKQGQGKPVSQRNAYTWRKAMDKEWGLGTHWVIPAK